MITLHLPQSRRTPLTWVADIILGEMLGLPFAVAESPDDTVVIAAEGRQLVIASQFPDLAADRETWRAQIPALPLKQFECASCGLESEALDAALPVLFGEPVIKLEDRTITCGIDVFGAAFFMLSRFEEIAEPNGDEHGRYPGRASLAWRADFLYRPLVDDYVALLWALMQRLWPTMQRRQRQGTVRISCDVDQPFDRVGVSPAKLLRSLAGDLGRRRDPAMAWRRTCNFIAHRHGDFRFDPYYTFDWYMDSCERHGLQAAFYFIADHSAGEIDGTYEIEEPRVLDLMRKMAQRGHEIGMHGSYNTFQDPAQIRRERARLQVAAGKAGLSAPIAGNRQHYLRWDAGQTPDHLDAAGFAYDTTGGFADLPGFRHGTSHDFAMWSWQSLVPLSLRQKPLVVMECSVISPAYLGLGHAKAAEDLMRLLKQRALRSGGDFGFLWHNSHLLTPDDRRLMQTLLG